MSGSDRSWIPPDEVALGVVAVIASDKGASLGRAFRRLCISSLATPGPKETTHFAEASMVGLGVGLIVLLGLRVLWKPPERRWRLLDASVVTFIVGALLESVELSVGTTHPARMLTKTVFFLCFIMITVFLPLSSASKSAKQRAVAAEIIYRLIVGGALSLVFGQDIWSHWVSPASIETFPDGTVPELDLPFGVMLVCTVLYGATLATARAAGRQWVVAACLLYIAAAASYPALMGHSEDSVGAGIVGLAGVVPLLAVSAARETRFFTASIGVSAICFGMLVAIAAQFTSHTEISWWRLAPLGVLIGSLLAIAEGLFLGIEARRVSTPLGSS